MRHRVRKHLKFSNKSYSHRDAMQRNLLTSFFMHKSVKTTVKKAKLIVPMVDKLINVVNTKDEMNAIRYVMKYLFTKDASIELFKNVITSWIEIILYICSKKLYFNILSQIVLFKL